MPAKPVVKPVSTSGPVSVNGIADMFKVSLQLVQKPTETVKYVGNANMKDPIILLVIAGFVTGIASAVINFLIQLLTMNVMGAVLSLLTIPLFSAILTPVMSLILGGLVYLVAKALGGKATFTQQFYLTTLAIITGSIAVGVGAAIPCIGMLIGFVGGLYLLYVEIVVVRDVHQLTTGMAAVAVLLPIVVLTIVVVVLVFVLYAAMFAALLGAGAMSGGLGAGLGGS
jgi:hypothetical protein